MSIFLGTFSEIAAVRIPLDYFSVLGIPFQVSEDQISQAYQDRLVQLPRREFGEAAIAARNRLLRSAYEVLADEEQRQAYQQLWWPTPEPTESSPELNESGQPSLEVVPADLIGALLILQDLGEYELVLTFAEAEIYHPEDPDAIAPTRSDLVLITALAYLEISREQWQRSDYEGAAHAGLKGLARLQQEDLFANVQEEIRDEIYKLRPYRILEFLTKDGETDSTSDLAQNGERLKAIELLKDMIQDRFGIEGRGNDRSGLGIDDFLQFIQQLRPYLTVDEQETLFLAEADRPSVIASFLAVYALLAKGIAAKQPKKLEECKMLLAKLKNRQEVALEEAICALLLGQTELALLALKDCHDEKAIASIREQSADQSDLIPGLYSYTEQWLEKDIFPCFWDLHPERQLVSLEDYFADVSVQNYLEKITPSPPLNAVSPIDRENTMALKLTEYLEPIPRPSKRRNRLGESSLGSKTASAQSTLLMNPPLEDSSTSLVWSSTTEPFM
ncbi:MAG: J domain-containing protein, partial [Microcystaceae cyanobacterium]